MGRYCTPNAICRIKTVRQIEKLLEIVRVSDEKLGILIAADVIL
jgi:hypothetical protein